MSRRPYKRSADPDVAQLQDVAADAARAPVLPDRAPGLITAVPTLAELRKTPGDVAGQAGPPAITVSGIKAPGDNGPTMHFAWKPGSTQDDNNADNSTGPGVVQVVGIDRGRWVRASAADETAALNVFTATAAGLAPASGGGTTAFLRADATFAVPPTVGTSAPGYAPTSPGGTTTFLRADGSWATPPAPAGLTLLRRSVLTAGTSLAKATGCTFATARLLGGGGGGGGASGSVAMGGGGAAGGVAEASTSSIPATWTYAIGAAGSAGSSAGGNGGAGGNTTFTTGASTITANGGSGGIGSTSATGPTVTAGGAPTAVSVNGDVNGGGAPGGMGLALNNTAATAVSGAGGSSMYGGGGPQRFGVSGAAAGGAGIGFGAGGSGAVSTGSGVAGGAGAPGVIVLEEWG